MDGWIKIHRKILDNPIFSDPDLLRLWIYCLAKASYKETKVIIEKQEVNLLPGQFITGRFALYKEFNLGVAPRKKIKDTTLWSWLKRLETYGNLDIKSYSKYSVVTVVKWIEYQETLTTEPQQIDNKLTTEPQQTDTNKKEKKDKNDKNEKKKDIITKISFSESVKLTQPEYDRLVSEFGKEITEKAIDYLTMYKAEKGYKTKSDNLTIRRWVIDAVSKQKGGNSFGKHEGHNVRPTSQSKFASADKNRPVDTKDVDTIDLAELGLF